MEVREARADELAAADAVRIATWQLAYRGIVPDAHLDALAVTEERVAWLLSRYDEGSSTTYVALHDGRVVGMAVRGPGRDEDREGQPELYALYVLPEHWGSGAAQALWEACQPVTSLWVLADNTRARAFYARNGLRPDVTKVVEVGAPLTEVRYLLT